MNIEQNIACGMQMINDSQYYRWKPSEDKWLPKLATTTREMVLRKCNCGIFARARGLDFPVVENVSELKPNTFPAVGHGVLFTYGHLAVITEMSNDGFFIIESNFKKCKVTRRFIDWNSEFIKGFYN